MTRRLTSLRETSHLLFTLSPHQAHIHRIMGSFMHERFPEGSDPDLANIPSFDSTVDIGDTCTVTLTYLTTLELRIQWSHFQMQNSTAYYMIAFKNVTKSRFPYHNDHASDTVE